MSSVGRRALPPSITAVNFFSKIRHKRHFLVGRMGRITTGSKLCSTLVAFPMRPERIVRATCHPRLLSSPARGLRLLRAVRMSCYFLLPFARRLSLFSTQRFVRLLHGGFGVRALIVNCSRHFNRGHDRGFRSCYHCNRRLGVCVMHTQTCASGRNGVDSSIVHRLLGRNRMDRTTGFLKCGCCLSKAIMSNCGMNEGVKFPATGLRISYDSGLVPSRKICTMCMCIRKGG